MATKTLPITFYDKVVDEENVLEPDMGEISEVTKAVIKIAKEKGENINLYFNGTVVTISPGSNVAEVLSNWSRIRRFQQK